MFQSQINVGRTPLSSSLQTFTFVNKVN